MTENFSFIFKIPFFCRFPLSIAFYEIFSAILPTEDIIVNQILPGNLLILSGQKNKREFIIHIIQWRMQTTTLIQVFFVLYWDAFRKMQNLKPFGFDKP